MKKFISFVMAGAMVASLVPATAFAKGEVTATAKIVDALEESKDFDGKIKGADVPEVQLKVKDADYQTTADSKLPSMTVEFTLDKAEFDTDDVDTLLSRLSIYRNSKNVLDRDAEEDSDIVTGAVTPGEKTYTEVPVANVDAGGDYTITKAELADVTGVAKKYIRWQLYHFR